MTESPFRKADFHIHTPASDCYNDTSVTAGEIVDAALAAGLEIIAITDHNSFSAIDRIAPVAAEKGLFVFPGIELSTQGGHFTGIFDIGTPAEKLNGFLNDIGIESSYRGDASFINRNGTEEVLRRIDEWGGIAIAAHIERWPSGFLETTLSRTEKMAIHASRYLSALEITIPLNRESWNKGLVRNYPKKYACIQSSDAHNLDEIGRRSVYISMDSVNLESLKAVFNDFEGKIAFPDDLEID